MEIGQVCVKLAGRDAGKVCVVVDHVEKQFVLIDGNVRRRKCNAMHLEPMDQILKLKKGASHADVTAEFKKLNLPMWNTKPKKKTERSLRKRIVPAVKAEAKPKAEKKAPTKKAKKAA